MSDTALWLFLLTPIFDGLVCATQWWQALCHWRAKKPVPLTYRLGLVVTTAIFLSSIAFSILVFAFFAGAELAPEVNFTLLYAGAILPSLALSPWLILFLMGRFGRTPEDKA